PLATLCVHPRNPTNFPKLSSSLSDLHHSLYVIRICLRVTHPLDTRSYIPSNTCSPYQCFSPSCSSNDARRAHTPDAHDLPTSATRVTCVTSVTHVTFLMMPRPYNQ